jgi:hypothetical protein
VPAAKEGFGYDKITEEEGFGYDKITEEEGFGYDKIKEEDFEYDKIEGYNGNDNGYSTFDKL